MENKENKNGSLNLKKILTYGALTAGGLLMARSVIKSARKLKLKNKVVLITGGSRGLGLIMAKMFIKKGAKVAICARDEKELQRAEEKINSKTKSILALSCDLRDKEQIKKMIQDIEDKWGGIDVLINNAGIIQVGSSEEMKEEDYRSAMDIHFWAPFHTISEVLPSMKNKGKGNIVNIVSIGGKISFPHLLPYNASKFALSGLSEGLTAELAKYNIKVTTVYPGLLTTGSPLNIEVKGQNKKEFAWFSIADSLPLISMNANNAGKKIIKSMVRGEKTLTLTAPAKIAELLHEVAPDLTISFFDLINRVLPEPDGIGKESKKGYESGSSVSNSVLTNSTQEAAVKNNEG